MTSRGKIEKLTIQGAILGAILFLALPMPSEVFAAPTTLSGLATRFADNQLNPILNFISAICYIAGAGLIIVGGQKLKAHAENPANAKLPPALARLAIGGSVIALPYAAGAVFNTLFGSASGTGSFSQFNVVQ